MKHILPITSILLEITLFYILYFLGSFESNKSDLEKNTTSNFTKFHNRTISGIYFEVYSVIY